MQDPQNVPACLVQHWKVGSTGRWINYETGTRSDVPHNMIYPLKDTSPNLHYLTNVLVKHVTADEFVRLLHVYSPVWKDCIQ